MSYLILITGILLLIVLISYWKCNAFLSFIIAAFWLGLWNNMNVETLVTSIGQGIGSILGSLLIILCFGAMQGKIIVSCGAAQKITDHLIRVFGIKYLQWALLLTGFIVGIPLFYGVGFVLLAPLVINLSVQKKLPAVWLGMPMLMVLSALHGFLPPHPAPVALTEMLNGNIGKTLLMGIIAATAAMLVAGVFYARFLKGITNRPMSAFVSERKPDNELPGLFYSYLACFLPILLIGAAAIVQSFFPSGSKLPAVAAFIISIGNPVVAMTLSLLFSILVLGRKGGGLKQSMQLSEKAIMDIAPVVMVIAGAGAFNQVLTDCGLTKQLTQDLSQVHTSPLVLGFIVAMIIRVATGSATIAGLTAAGIIKPLFLQTHLPAELMVLSIGAGSLMLSHVNDGGFWLFKEYFNLSIKQTLKSWTVAESLLGLTGLLMVLLLKYLFY